MIKWVEPGERFAIDRDDRRLRRSRVRWFVEVALARAGGNRTRAAAHLGVTRQGLLKLIARLGLE